MRTRGFMARWFPGCGSGACRAAMLSPGQGQGLGLGGLGLAGSGAGRLVPAGPELAASYSRMTSRACANSIPTLTSRVQITTAAMSESLVLRMNRCTRWSLLMRISLK